MCEARINNPAETCTAASCNPESLKRSTLLWGKKSKRTKKQKHGGKSELYE